MRKLIRSVLETPNAEHILPKTISRPKSMLTVILYFSDIRPPLTEQFDLFDAEAQRSDSPEALGQTLPIDSPQSGISPRHQRVS
jgi:hypothetical protein